MTHRCVGCTGKGHVIKSIPWPECGEVPLAMVCPACHGSGIIVTDCSGDSCSMEEREDE